MPPTAPLAIATSSVRRLVKEEASYHRELEEQAKRVAKLESEAGADDDGNHEFLLKQEVRQVFSRIFSIVATGIEN
jgi:tubulin-specific chaperone A